MGVGIDYGVIWLIVAAVVVAAILLWGLTRETKL